MFDSSFLVSNTLILGYYLMIYYNISIAIDISKYILNYI